VKPASCICGRFSGQKPVAVRRRSMSSPPSRSFSPQTRRRAASRARRPQGTGGWQDQLWTSGQDDESDRGAAATEVPSEARAGHDGRHQPQPHPQSPMQAYASLARKRFIVMQAQRQEERGLGRAYRTRTI
jgi:hypothetical protein